MMTKLELENVLAAHYAQNIKEKNRRKNMTPKQKYDVLDKLVKDYFQDTEVRLAESSILDLLIWAAEQVTSDVESKPSIIKEEKE